MPGQIGFFLYAILLVLPQVPGDWGWEGGVGPRVPARPKEPQLAVEAASGKRVLPTTARSREQDRCCFSVGSADIAPRNRVADDYRMHAFPPL